MHVLVTRPEPDALKLKGLLEERGHGAAVEPLHEVSFEHADPIDLEGVTGLVATSRHGLTALALDPELLAAARGLTVFAVGAATARTARQLGFRRVLKGPGTAAALVPVIASTLDAAEEMLLHLAGERVTVDIAGELAALGVRASTAHVYRMVARTSLSGPLRDMIRGGDIDGVLLLSGEAAVVWARLALAAGLGTACREIVHLCLSDGVAQRLAPLGRVPVEIADGPTLEDALALVDEVAARLQL